MENLLLDVLIGLVGAVSGWTIKSFFTKKLPTPVPDDTSLPTVPEVTNFKDRCYVRFHYLDGRVDVRPFLSTDLGFTMRWKGRYFKIGDWTEDGQVYTEISRRTWRKITAENPN